MNKGRLSFKRPDRPLYAVIVVAAALLGALNVLVYLFSPATTFSVVPWYLPTVHTFVALCSFCVAFLALGRHQVLRYPAPFWIGIAYLAYSILTVFRLLVFPTLPGNKGIIETLPSTSPWLVNLQTATLAVCVIAAPFIRAPREKKSAWGVTLLAVAAVTAAGTALVHMDGILPVMVVAGKFTEAEVVVLLCIAVLLFTSAVIAAIAYLESGDHLFAYTALSQLTVTSSVAMNALGAAWFTLPFYLGRNIVVVGALIMLFGLLTDYVRLARTEQEKSQELAKTQARLRRIFDSGMIGLIYWNMQGEILDANDSFLQMLGRTRQELEAGTINWSELTPPEYDAMDQYALDELRATGLDTPYEKEFLRSDGTRVPIIIGAATLSEAPEEGVAFVLDITERKRAEQEIREARNSLEVRVQERTEELRHALHNLQAETEERLRAVEELRLREHLLLQQNRLAAMGEMLVNISHQWRQPLNVLGLILQNLARSYDRGNLSTEALQKSVDRGTELIEHMSKTIEDFSAYLTPDKTKMPFNIGEVISNAVSMMDETLRGVAVVVQNPGGPVYATGYPNEYVQVVINILVNARDALREKNIPDPWITIRIAKHDDKSVVTISDNAGGIAADVLDKIFDPYFTTKPPGKGTGIGLFMSKSIIEQSMGGRLTARNTDSGAQFTIEV